MKKFILSLFVSFIFCFGVNANEINKYIKESDFELKSTVSVYVEDINNNSVLYKKHPQKLLNPASTLKTLTFGVSYLILGECYKFETELYKDTQNNIYLKLGGDTLLTQDDLNSLISNLKTTQINNFYIDDTIIDSSLYPKGWMKEDMWPNARMISPYIIDNNTTKIAINRSSLATKIDIIQNDDYKIPIINELKLGDLQDYKIVRLYGDNSSIVNFQGTIVKDEIIDLPVLRPDINFKISVQKALKKNDIKFEKTICTKKTPQNAKKISSVSHSIEEISKNILLNSDNFSSEVVFKVAAAKYLNYQKTATLQDAIEMFNYVFKDILTEGIKIDDASGVSRYNLINTEFYCKALKKLFKETNLKCLLATSNQGTLSNRLLFLENNVRAKTGTLSQMSAIAGGLTTRKNKDIVFAIIVQNSPKRKAVLKNFENTLIGIIYKKY